MINYSLSAITVLVYKNLQNYLTTEFENDYSYHPYHPMDCAYGEVLDNYLADPPS